MLLLDDVMSELDRNRRMKLIDEISPYQTFITCTDQSDLEQELNRRTYEVSNEAGIANLILTDSGSEMILQEPAEPDFS